LFHAVVVAGAAFAATAACVSSSDPPNEPDEGVDASTVTSVDSATSGPETGPLVPEEDDAAIVDAGPDGDAAHDGDAGWPPTK
jgi:hypothetical protein